MLQKHNQSKVPQPDTSLTASLLGLSEPTRIHLFVQGLSKRIRMDGTNTKALRERRTQYDLCTAKSRPLQGRVDLFYPLMFPGTDRSGADFGVQTKVASSY